MKTTNLAPKNSGFAAFTGYAGTLGKHTKKQFIERILAMPLGPRRDQAIQLAYKKYGKKADLKRFRPYRFKPAQYISDFLKWDPWNGMDEDHPGQAEILDACAVVMRQQEEKDNFEKGKLKENELHYWSPDKSNPKNSIQNWIRVESGNGIGKTKSASGILNWFLDCFTPSAIFTLAPGGEQARLVLWSEIRADRENKGLPGKILEKEIKITSKHFAVHRTASTGGGKGEERLKGKHEAYQLFILDEADGIDEFIFDAIVSMTSGGKNLVVMFANPKSRSTMFHRCRTRSYVQTFRVSTLFHPNVRAGWEQIPNAVKREFVEKKLENDCTIIHLHNDETCQCRPNCACQETFKVAKKDVVKCDGYHKSIKKPADFPFELPYDVNVAKKHCPKGTIFKPNNRFMTDILGITPPNSTDDTLIPVGHFEAAKAKLPQGGDKTWARVGVDAAWMGDDMGKMYIRWQDAVWMACEFSKQESHQYVAEIRKQCLALKAKGVKSLHIRVDAGMGSGIIGDLRIDDELINAFEDYEVFVVNFGGTPYNIKDYANTATEMYAEAAEAVLGLSILQPPDRLEADLCERKYLFRHKSGKTVKILEVKDEYKKRKKHSPDDGDAFVMAVAPDYCFNKVSYSVVNPTDAKPQVNRQNPLDDVLNELLNS